MEETERVQLLPRKAGPSSLCAGPGFLARSLRGGGSSWGRFGPAMDDPEPAAWWGLQLQRQEDSGFPRLLQKQDATDTVPLPHGPGSGRRFAGEPLQC